MKGTRGFASQLVVGGLLVTGAGTAWLVSGRGQDQAFPVEGRYVWIRKSTGDSLRAYLAAPVRSTTAPAMVVIHEIFGLTDWEPTVADRLASRGYIAIAPDMLSSRFGPSPASPDSGRKLMAQLQPDAITADLDAAFNYLESMPSVKTGQIGAIGFCWGGGQTFRYATNNPGLKAAVVCYGPAPDTAALSRITAPVLGIYGENDARINSMLPTVQRVMKGLGKPFTADSYPGTGHGFLKPGRRGHDSDQPAKAWADIEKFLKTHLK